ncbi:zinc ribbon domain-containing protein [Gordonia sp. ABSL49_1]|uniref:zinc ribbon domain-containing protein n=1 Tax=Gordonia sp. ABSL49_1 TaxID=2920941 RepID=UPI001F0E5663|nr:C4-type zinc ribbon domain-containing protein [Gordonia sp. ABSL49_1]MCH5644460.1 C4-type zinc ribbon domain-containing protein [Gordonia sp. ABSL49_1]
MIAEAGAQRLLLELADADAEIARLDHRRATLAEDAEIADTERELDAARDDLVRSEISGEDLTREYRRIDSEVTGMAAREKKDSALLTAGGLAPKALSELQHELAGLGRRRSVLEDDLLSVMEQQEALEAERGRAAATIEHLEGKLAAVRVRREESITSIETDRGDKQRRRDDIAAEVAPELLAVYDRQRSAGRVGAGLLRARRCGACRMELDRGTIARISAASSDEVIRCEECGAILVRTAESGL